MGKVECQQVKECRVGPSERKNHGSVVRRCDTGKLLGPTGGQVVKTLDHAVIAAARTLRRRVYRSLQ